ncbi:MAG TPA: 16S rRNA (guanine(966)-N(2))-methyltransferase RsmD [Burkholderiales bacterium]|nr:16S rRNA (guanine(966)-N(2))-methyltransferase RsmD [Burkholderiales bacterium]
MRTKGSNAVRIVGGEWRSRVIRFPATRGLRPTPDSVRERLFNWLGQDLTGRRCLDLFAGSGALGFEALSRGAAEVVMVESSRLVHRRLRETAEALGAGARLRLVLGDALHFLASPPRHGFDVVFVDPPYSSGLAARVLERLPGALAPGAVVYVESDSAFAAGPGWRVTREGRAGAVHHRLMQWGGQDEGSLPGDVRPADTRA